MVACTSAKSAGIENLLKLTDPLGSVSSPLMIPVSE